MFGYLILKMVWEDSQTCGYFLPAQRSQVSRPFCTYSFSELGIFYNYP